MVSTQPAGGVGELPAGSDALQQSQEHSAKSSSGGKAEPAVMQFSPERESQFAMDCRTAMARGMLQDPSTLYFAKQQHFLQMYLSMIRLNYAAARSYSEPPLFFATECASAGAMCFIYPQQQVTFWQYMRLGGLAPLVKHMKPSRWLAAFRHQSAIDEAKAAWKKQQQWPSFIFLWLIAAPPEHQGRGLGSLLMQRINQAADERGLPIYLESTTERSRAFYRRHGFQDLRTLRPEPGKPQAPAYFLMMRPPGGGPQGGSGEAAAGGALVAGAAAAAAGR